MNRNEFSAIGEGRFHLHLTDHFGDAFHDLVASKNFPALGHKLSDRLAVARSLQNEVRYERYALGVIELDRKSVV